MKQKLFSFCSRMLLMMAVVFGLPVTVLADELTVNDGTATNTYVPAYGLYFDGSSTHSQCFFPADQLAVMEGATINGITFYSNTSSTPTEWSNVLLKVSLVETTAANLGTFETISSTDVMATLAPTLVSGQFVIAFVQPYEYQGGNLVIDVAVSKAGDYASAPWLGVESYALYGRYASSGAGTAVYFAPKTTFDYDPATGCARPGTPVASEVTDATATLTWEAAEEVTQYQYALVAAGAAVDWASATLVSDVTVSLSGLESNTSYDFYVRSYCGTEEGEQSRERKVTFKTSCGAAVLPWSENFDGTVDMACWAPLPSGVDVTTSSSYVTGKALRFATVGSPVVVLPNMGDLQGKRLQFMYRSEGSGSTTTMGFIKAGYITNPADTSTFVTVLDINEHAWEKTYWEVFYEDAVPAGARPALKYYGSTASGWYVFVDELKVDVIPTCRVIKNLAFVSATENSATFSWTPGLDETEWIVKAVVPGQTDTVSDVVNTPSFTLSGLNASTIYTYKVSVLSKCADDEFAEKAIVKDFQFQTACQPVTTATDTIVFGAEGALMNGLPACHETTVGKKGTTEYRWKAQTSYVKSGSRSYQAEEHYTDTISTVLTLPQMEIPENSELMLFAYLSSSAVSASHDTLRVWINDSPTLEGATKLGELYGLKELTTKKDSVRFSLADYRDNYYIMLEAKAYYGIYVDDITIRPLPDCAPSSALKLDEVGTETITLSWTPAGDEENWFYSYSLQPDIAGEDPLESEDQVDGDPVLTIEELHPATHYTGWVEIYTYCDPDAGIMSEEAVRLEVDFVTECEILNFDDVAPADVAWMETFDGWSHSTSGNTVDRVCWENTYKSGNKWQAIYNMNYAHMTEGSDTVCLRLYQTSSYSTSRAFLTLPQMHLDEANGFELSFWYKRGSTSPTDSLAVYVSRFAHPDSTKTYIGGLKSITTSYQQFKAYIPMEGDVYIILEGCESTSSYNSSNAIYVDDIAVRRLSNCRKVTELSTDATTTSLTINWTPANGETEWVLRINGQDTLISGTPSFVIDTLRPATQYSFPIVLKTKCGEIFAEDSLVSTLAFATDCEPHALPVTYGFESSEGFTAGSMYSGFTGLPICWATKSLVNFDASNAAYDWVVSTSAKHNGTYGLALPMKGETAAGKASHTLLSLPVVTMEAEKDYEIGFWIKRESTTAAKRGDGFNIFVSNEEEFDAATARNLGYATVNRDSVTTIMGKEMADGWYFYTVDVPAEVRGNVYVCFEAITTRGYVYIDDVVIREKALCAAVRSLHSIDSLLTTRSMTYAWEGDAESYDVLFLGKDTIVKHVADTFCVLDGLQPATRYTYTVKVVPQCVAGAAIDTISLSSTFLTNCELLSSFPIRYGFEASEGFDVRSSAPASNTLPTCWDTKNIVATGSSTSNQWYASTVSKHSGSSALCLPDKGSSSSISKTLLSFPAMQMDADTEYELIFWLYRNASGANQEGFRIFVSHNEEFDETAVELGFAARNYQLETAIMPAEAASGWYKYIVEIPMTGLVNLFFQGESFYGSGTYADDIVIREKPACAAVSDIHVIDSVATATTAVIAWSGSADAGYDIRLFGKDTIATHVADTFYTIEGLEASSAYIYGIEVVSQCVAGAAVDTTVASGLRVRTACVELEVPYSTGFELALAGEVPACWTATSNVTVYTGASYVAEGKQSLRLYGGGSTSARYAVMPKFADEADLQGARIVFDYKSDVNSYSAVYGQVVVGAMSDPENVSTFVGLDTLDKTAAFLEHETYLTNVPDTCHYIAFAYKGGTSDYGAAYIDNIRISEQPSCFPGTNLHVVDSLIATDSVVFAWSDAAAAQWRVVAKRHGEVFATAVVNDSCFVINGLEPGTRDTVELVVYSICSEDVESADSLKATLLFATECVPVATVQLPYQENFDSYSSSAHEISPCWYKASTYNDSYPFASSTYHYGASGNALYFYANAAVPNYSLAVLPEFESDVHDLQVAFMGFMNAADCPIYVGVMTDVEDTATFVKVAEILPSQRGTWEDFEVAFDQYTGADGRIAFMMQKTSVFAIDNVDVRLIPSCKSLRSMATANIERRELDLSWVVKDSASMNFEVVVSEVALDAAALEAAEKIVVADTCGVHLTGLTRDTQYTIYARVACSDSDKSDWLSTTAKTKDLGPDCSISEDFVIGQSTTAIQYSPWGDYYKSYYTQQIYTAAELAAQGLSAGFISKIAFQYAYTSSYTKTVTMYLGTTTADAFASTSYLPVEQVSTAKSITFRTKDSWYEMEFDAPYYWDGESNLVVGMLAMGTDYPTSGTTTFYGTTSTKNVTLYSRTDSGTPGQTTGTAHKGRASARFTVCGQESPCPTVETVSAELTGNGAHSAMISWSKPEGDYAHTYEVIISDTAIVDFEGLVADYTVQDSLSVEAINLAAFTDYYAYVRVLCDGEGHDDGSSQWNYTTFKTQSDCPTILDLVAEVTGKTTAVANWVAYDAEHSDFVYVLSDEVLDAEALAAAEKTAQADTFLVMNALPADTEMHLYVATDCGAGAYSPFEHVSFLTPKTCPAVANLHAVDSTSNTVTLAWERGWLGDETEWQVGVVGSEAHTRMVSDSTVLIFGLESDSVYTFFVKAQCAELSDAATVACHTKAAPAGCEPIGTVNSSSSAYPVNTYYNYSLSEQIFLASELAGAGNLQSIAVSTTSSYYNYYRDIKVYVKHTTKSGFSSSTDWESVTSADCVFDGSVKFGGSGWSTITFSTPFAYNGTDNLLIVIDDNTGDYESSTMSFRTMNDATEYRTLYYADDGADLDPLYTIYSYGTRTYARNYIQFCFELADCQKPSALKATDITTNSAKLSWMPGAAEMHWDLVCSDTELDATALEAAEKTVVSDLGFALTGLSQDQDYYVYVRSQCSEEESSDWAKATFHTIATCLVPVAGTATEIGETSAQLNWKEMNEGFAGDYTVIYGPSATFDVKDATTYEQIENVADTFVVITGLNANTLYSFAVSSNCSEEDHSRWSNVAQLRTNCGVMTVFPWTEDFESYAQARFADPCWTNVQVEAGTGSGSTNLGFTITTAVGHAGKVLSLPDMKAGEVTRLTLPTFAIAAADAYEFKLDINRNVSDKPTEGIRIFMVGDDDVEHEICFISHDYTVASGDLIPAETEGGWYTYSMPIPVAGDVRIILQGESQYKNATYMDNFVIRQIPTCKKPYDLVKGEVTENSVLFQWSDSVAYEWDVMAVNTATHDTVRQHVSTPNFEINSLQHSTVYTYEVTVWAVCDDDEKSDAVQQTFRFTTPMPQSFYEFLTLDVPYETTFSDDADNVKWQFVNGTGTNKFIIGTDADALVDDATSALYVSNSTSWNYGTSSTSGAFAYRLFRIAYEDATLDIEFDWQANGESTFDYGMAFFAPASTILSASSNTLKLNETTVTHSTTAAQLPAGVTRIGEEKLNLKSTWQTASATNVSIAEPGDYMLIFAWRNDGSGGNQKPFGVSYVSVELTSGTATKVENTFGADSVKAVKILRDGKVFILRGNDVYTIMGQKVNL